MVGFSVLPPVRIPGPIQATVTFVGFDAPLMIPRPVTQSIPDEGVVE